MKSVEEWRVELEIDYTFLTTATLDDYGARKTSRAMFIGMLDLLHFTGLINTDEYRFLNDAVWALL